MGKGERKPDSRDKWVGGEDVGAERVDNSSGKRGWVEAKGDAGSRASV